MHVRLQTPGQFLTSLQSLVEGHFPEGQRKPSGKEMKALALEVSRKLTW